MRWGKCIVPKSIRAAEEENRRVEDEIPV